MIWVVNVLGGTLLAVFLLACMMVPLAVVIFAVRGISIAFGRATHRSKP
jgi:hypothetical protein